MKPYLKTSVVAFLISIIISAFFAIIQFMLYNIESFDNFFGFPVAKFNLIHYIILTICLTMIFTILIQSDDKEEQE